MAKVSSFTFGTYQVDTARSIVSFTYHVTFKNGKRRTYTDRLFLKDVTPENWESVPKSVLEPTLQALLLMLGINYWTVFPTRNMYIDGFSLTREQADFWNTLYLHGLGEYFFDMKMDFKDLIAFPYNETLEAPIPTRLELPTRALVLNGAGKDSILSAELLKASHVPFDFFAFSPTPAHERIAKLVGERTIRANRLRDGRVSLHASLHLVSAAYPSVSTFTFVAVLLSELLGYDSLVFSNERSADFGNLTYRGLKVNHQWCKSSTAEKLINDYVHSFITPDIKTMSLLREYSELEIVRRFIGYPKYLPYVTSCNSYFWQPRLQQLLQRKAYWCNECPKCVFLFACFSAFLPKKVVLEMFGSNLYRKRRHLKLIRRILGTEGFKPLDCVGEPEEMILAMHYASRTGEYKNDRAMRMFENLFPSSYDFKTLEEEILCRASTT